MSVLSREGAPWRNWSHNTARNASSEARRSKKRSGGLSGKRKLANLRIEDKKLTKAFQEIWKIKKEKDITFRQAAYVRAVDRITLAMRFRGIWP